MIFQPKCQIKLWQKVTKKNYLQKDTITGHYLFFIQIIYGIFQLSKIIGYQYDKAHSDALTQEVFPFFLDPDQGQIQHTKYKHRMKQLLSGADVHIMCILRDLCQSTRVQFCELDACSGWGVLNELILSFKKSSQHTWRLLHNGNQTALAGHHSETCFSRTLLIQTQMLMWGHPKSTTGKQHAKFSSAFCIYLEVRRANMKMTLWSAQQELSTRVNPCQHMGSCYPWCVINTTNRSNVFILGFSLT